MLARPRVAKCGSEAGVVLGTYGRHPLHHEARARSTAMAAAAHQAGGLTRSQVLRRGMGALVPVASGIGLASCGAESPGAGTAAAKPATLTINTDWIGANPRGQVTDGAVAEYK